MPKTLTAAAKFPTNTSTKLIAEKQHLIAYASSPIAVCVRLGSCKEKAAVTVNLSLHLHKTTAAPVGALSPGKHGSLLQEQSVQIASFPSRRWPSSFLLPFSQLCPKTCCYTVNEPK